jgi:hypothetical protein
MQVVRARAETASTDFVFIRLSVASSTDRKNELKCGVNMIYDNMAAYDQVMPHIGHAMRR